MNKSDIQGMSLKEKRIFIFGMRTMAEKTKDTTNFIPLKNSMQDEINWCNQLELHLIDKHGLCFEKKYLVELSEDEFFVVLNSLYNKMQELNDCDKPMVSKIIDKFDEKYFKR